LFWARRMSFDRAPPKYTPPSNFLPPPPQGLRIEGFVSLSSILPPPFFGFLFNQPPFRIFVVPFGDAIAPLLPWRICPKPEHSLTLHNPYLLLMPTKARYDCQLLCSINCAPLLFFPLEKERISSVTFPPDWNLRQLVPPPPMSPDVCSCPPPCSSTGPFVKAALECPPCPPAP